MEESNNLDFKITVEFICNDMIDLDTLRECYNGNPFKAYRDISCDFNDSVINFSTLKERVLDVEVY